MLTGRILDAATAERPADQSGGSSYIPVMEGYFSALSPNGPLWWLGLGLVLLIGELLTGTTFLLWPAIAAAVTGAVLFFVPLPLPLQLFLFGAAALTGVYLGRRFLMRRLGASARDRINDRARKLVGQATVAVGPFDHGVGRVRLGDSEWRAESEDAVAGGERLVVVAVKGATLRVRRADAAAIA